MEGNLAHRMDRSDAKRPMKVEKSRKEKRDDDIMATNNSSIVSKRSVEMLYFKDEPAFFRYFVKKPRRRSPLINRGYWLRMKAVDVVIEEFLRQPSQKQKLIFNLGCGYDPLPWQCNSRYPRLCENVKFVDVDYQQLIAKKCEIIQNTEELRCHFKDLSWNNDANAAVLANSTSYAAVGCDLTDLDRLDKTLRTEFRIDECEIICVAEVSVTYMDTLNVDKLIQYWSRFNNAQFCLLEQYLPNGPSNPFAQTMLKHFESLQTPLKSILRYPALLDQADRFRLNGWENVFISSLWGLWGNDKFLSPEQRKKLDRVEPFDEWEEFALFGSHYLLLVASHDRPMSMFKSNLQEPFDQKLPRSPYVFREIQDFNNLEKRRFGAIGHFDSSAIAFHGGLGQATRTASVDIISSSNKVAATSIVPPGHMIARMCHSIVQMSNEGELLLIGGRTTPTNSLSDCWLFQNQLWKRVQDLPGPRYRHCAVAVGNSTVLLFGGKDSEGQIHGEWLLWDYSVGWRRINILSAEAPAPRFGAIMAATSASSGFISGGIGADYEVIQDFWQWNWDETNVTLTFSNLAKTIIQPAEIANLSRFGACVAQTASKLFLIGGVVKSGVPSRGKEILLFDPQTYLISSLEPGSILSSLPVTSQPDVKEQLLNADAAPVIIEEIPLLIGCSAVAHNEHIAVLGGGAVCFSFGTFWNRSAWEIALQRTPALSWKVNPSIVQANEQDVNPKKLLSDAGNASISMIPVISSSIRNDMDFKQTISEARPIVFKGSNLGPCVQIWSMEYLKSKVGVDRPVVVHKASTAQMSFRSKNFEYVTLEFGNFLDRIAQGEKLYLRSVSSNNPSKIPTDFTRDFPTISDDFKLPRELNYALDNMHSSPIRLSGPVNMWLHYDVMSNILCQVKGTKRVLLFPPSDVTQLEFAPGASSTSLNPFKRSIPDTHPYEALLEPGDILFIPSLWLHAAAPTDQMSISVNVFFRDLQSGYAAGRDVYGNRDLQPYERGRIDVAKIIKSFDGLSAETAKFYLQRLAAELEDSAARL